jgi:peptide-methionine (R)-S-oxide reductase
MSPQIALTVVGALALVAAGYASFSEPQGGAQKATVVLGPNDPRNPSPGLTLTTKGPDRPDKMNLTEAEWRKRLTKEQYAIVRGHGTEAAFCSPLLDVHEKGTFYCIGCGNALFKTDAKFNSGTGWPSFWQPATPDAVWYRLDTGYGMRRTEVLCAKCDGHLGHVFDDGPVDKGGRRYCMNGEALIFKKDTPPVVKPPVKDIP